MPTPHVTELRRRPIQGRSALTFDLILDTAGMVLDEVGFEAFSTNAVSERSGVSIRAIYRYFPNKHAIVAELAERMAVRWRDAVDAAGDLTDPEMPWEPIWRGYLESFVRAVRSTPGGRSVLTAMRDDPTLRVVDDRANERYIVGIDAALRARRPDLSGDESQAIATVLMRSTVAVLDEAIGSTGEAALVAVLERMHLSLLRDVLGRRGHDRHGHDRPVV